MDVRIDEARRGEAALGLQDPNVRSVGGAGFENGRDPAAFDQNVRGMQLAADHVDQRRRPNDQIGRVGAQSNVDQLPSLHAAAAGLGQAIPRRGCAR